MKKFSYTTAKFFSSFLIAVCLIGFFCIARVTTLKQLYSYCDNHKQGELNKYRSNYLGPIDYIFRNCSQVLNDIYLASDMENSSPDQIIRNLKTHPVLKTEYITDYGFITLDGRVYLLDGKESSLTIHDIFKDFQNGNQDIFATNGVFAHRHDLPVISLIEKVYGPRNEIKGYVCIFIEKQGFCAMLDGINAGNEADIVIIDSEGKELFAKKQLSSEVAEKNSYDFIPIKMTPWRLGVKQNEAYYYKDYYIQRNSEITFLIVALIFVIAMLVIEIFVFRYFQRKEIVLSSFDQSTGLWTRQHFESRVRSFMRRNPTSKFLVIETDIRGFKFINQNYGCYCADEIIRSYGKEIKKLSDKMKGWCGHGYADHFYMCFKIDSVRAAMKDFHEGLDKINAEIKRSEIPYFVKFGLSFYLPAKDKPRETIESLIGQASFAKSTIKDDSLTQCAIYNSRIAEKIRREQSIETRMEEALNSGEFYVVYQPKIELSTEKIVGAEALVRWKSTEYGLLPPDQFIPLFEKNGFVKKLDFYVYEQVFKFLKELKLKNLPVVPISINMSRKHNSPDRFIHDFMEIFNKYDISPKLVQVELLEHSVMEETDLLYTTELLHREGFSVAIDDFGTGESSLTMLAKIPVDVLKFDKSFLSGSDSGGIDPKTQKFIRALIEISKELDKLTVFEGVETKEQKDFLKENNCDLVQGFYYSRPLEQEAFEKFLVEHA